MKYVVSLMLPDTGPVSLNPADYQEATVVMVTSGRTFLLEVKTDDGVTAYGHTKFFGTDTFRTFFSLQHQAFVVRGVYPTGKFREPPRIFRIYAQENFFVSATPDFAEQEECLVEIIQNFMGNIVQESARQLSLVKDSSVYEPMRTKVFAVPCKRSLAPEQRSSAQELLGAMHMQSTSIAPYIQTSDFLLDFDTWNFDSPRLNDSYTWKPRAGIATGSPGCGRRRTYSAAISVIASGQMPSKTSLSRYPAFKVTAIICKKESVHKWQEELDVPAYVIESAEDCDQLSFKNLDAGCAVIFTPDGIAALDEQEDALLNSLRDIYDYEIKPFTVHQLARMHCGLRMRETVACARWIQFRMMIVDDVSDMTQGSTILDAQICNTLKADWTWIHVLSTPSPTHLPPKWVENADIYLGLPESSRIYSFDTTTSQTSPAAFATLDAIHCRMRIPGSILRKVTLMPVPVTLFDTERGFIEAYKKIQQSLSAVAVPALEVSSLLLGGKMDDIDGLDLSSLLCRLQPMSSDAAEKSISNHFSIPGTVAQRILKAGSTKLNVQFAQTPVTRDFVMNPANRSEVCPICCTDEGAVIGLCGHNFCDSCVTMLRRAEVRTGYSSCPTCRASLCAYDWITRGTDSPPYTPSKIIALKDTVAAIFSRRRVKKRLGMVCLLFAPMDSCEAVRTILRSDYDVDVDELGDRNCVRVFSFQDAIGLCKKPLTIDVEAIVMASPAPFEFANIYNGIVRAASHRATPLQLHLLFALDNFEDVRGAMRALIPGDEPVRRFIRK